MNTVKRMNFNPTDEDRQWLKEQMSRLNQGGLIVTDLAMYRKKDNKTLVLVQTNDPLVYIGIDVVHVTRSINMMKATAESIGIRFVDTRAANCN